MLRINVLRILPMEGGFPIKCKLCGKEVLEGFILWDGSWEKRRITKSDDFRTLFGKIEFQWKRTTKKLKYSKYYLVLDGHFCVKVNKPLNRLRRLLLELSIYCIERGLYEIREPFFCTDCILANEELEKLPKYAFDEKSNLIRLENFPSSRTNWVKHG
jgi:hypothetical protein